MDTGRSNIERLLYHLSVGSARKNAACGGVNLHHLAGIRRIAHAVVHAQALLHVGDAVQIGSPVYAVSHAGEYHLVLPLLTFYEDAVFCKLGNHKLPVALLTFYIAVCRLTQEVEDVVIGVERKHRPHAAVNGITGCGTLGRCSNGCIASHGHLAIGKLHEEGVAATGHSLACEIMKLPSVLRRFQKLLSVLYSALDAVGSRVVEEFLVIVQTRLQAHAAQQANDSYKYMFHKSILF